MMCPEPWRPHEGITALQLRTQGATQARMLRELGRCARGAERIRAIVLAIDDLQWRTPPQSSSSLPSRGAESPRACSSSEPADKRSPRSPTPVEGCWRADGHRQRRRWCWGPSRLNCRWLHRRALGGATAFQAISHRTIHEATAATVVHDRAARRPRGRQMVSRADGAGSSWPSVRRSAPVFPTRFGS